MDIDTLTAGLHSPTIALNTNKSQIVENMTNNECFTIAKRTTHNLRDRSPDIRRLIENTTKDTLKFAKLLFTQELVKADQLSEAEVIQYHRMARIADAQKKHQQNTVTFFQNEAGYRICCLTSLAEENSFNQSNPLLEQMASLAAQQDTLNNSFLLSDLLEVMIKRASKYPEYNAEAQKAKYVKVLVDYTAIIRATLENCCLRKTEQSVSEYLDSQHAKQPQLSDSTQVALLSFALIRNCFELINQETIQQSTAITAPIINENPELRLLAV